jgi:hypothetical protein
MGDVLLRRPTRRIFVLSRKEAKGTEYVGHITSAEKLVMWRESDGDLRVEAKGGHGPKLWRVDTKGHAEQVDR